MDDMPDQTRLGPLPGYLGYNLRRAQAASFRHLDATAAGIDLSPGQFSLLTFLAANPDTSQTTIARVFGIDKSTLSPVLDAFARRGLITRKRADHDRRTNAIRLTGVGAALLARMRARVEAQEALMAATLAPEERARLLDMLRRITDALEADRAGPAQAAAE
jgi:DNA-binding MarR family transcriptional regulator